MAFLLNAGRAGILPLYEITFATVPGAVGSLSELQTIKHLPNKMLFQNYTDDKIAKMTSPKYQLSTTSWSLSNLGPQSTIASPRTTFGIGLRSSTRWIHTDIQVPDFNEVRKEGTKSPIDTGSHDSEIDRRFYSYVASTAGAAAALVAAKHTARAVVSMLEPTKAVQAAAKIEVDLSKIPEGKQITVKWGGKPLFVRHRTDAEISRENAVDVASLRHPEADDDRTKNPRWLVCIGICTHLGCVPIPHIGDYQGYYCPCHGSHYDASGRIRSGPAPKNLEVPDYEFLSDTRILVG